MQILVKAPVSYLLPFSINHYKNRNNTIKTKCSQYFICDKTCHITFHNSHNKIHNFNKVKLQMHKSLTFSLSCYFLIYFYSFNGLLCPSMHYMTLHINVCNFITFIQRILSYMILIPLCLEREVCRYCDES